MMAAPASNASRADCAIFSGDTGTIGCCLGSVKTPFKAHVRIALDIGRPLQLFDLEEKRRICHLRSRRHMRRRDPASVRGADARLHFHGFDERKRLPGFNPLPRLDTNFDHKPRNRRYNSASSAGIAVRVMAARLPEHK